jgi:hypothetical protein
MSLRTGCWKMCVGLILLIGVTSCAGGRAEEEAMPTPPDDVMSRAQFVEVFAETQLVEAAYKLHYFRNDDPERWVKGAYADVFAKYGVDEAFFWRSHSWWFAHPAAMVGIYEEATEILNQLESEKGGTTVKAADPMEGRRSVVDSTRLEGGKGPKNR